MATHNLDAAKLHFADLGFKICTGNRYLGGLLGDAAEWDTCLAHNI
jgi:hypothetical protein